MKTEAQASRATPLILRFAKPMERHLGGSGAKEALLGDGHETGVKVRRAFDTRDTRVNNETTDDD
jgi:hypothetical protein